MTKKVSQMFTFLFPHHFPTSLLFGVKFHPSDWMNNNTSSILIEKPSTCKGPHIGNYRQTQTICYTILNICWACTLITLTNSHGTVRLSSCEEELTNWKVYQTQLETAAVYKIEQKKVDQSKSDSSYLIM